MQNRTRIIKLLVVLRFRSSHQSLTRALANFGIGPLGVDLLVKRGACPGDMRHVAPRPLAEWLDGLP
jgi:hypothetical protein